MQTALQPRKVRAEFWRRFSCSETMLTLLNRSAGLEQKEWEEASDPLCGGILAGLDCACGVLWGGALAAGMRAYHQIQDEIKARSVALEATRSIVNTYLAKRTAVDCTDVTRMQRWNMPMFLAKGNLRVCQRQLVEFAPVFDQKIDETIEQAGKAAGCRQCANCAANAFLRVAEVIGVDAPEGASVCAGLAGGIGLSGNGCGALGASILALNLKYFKERDRPKHSMIRSNLQGMSIGDGWMRQSREVLGKFIDRHGSKKCSEITGRTFATETELDGYLRSGSCESVTDTLVNACADQVTR